MNSAPDGRSYEVRVWKTAAYKGKRGKTYRVRWRVGYRTHGRTMATSKAAESFRSELIAAQRRGEPFGIESGLPSSLQPKEASVTWYTHACEFVDLKWPHASPNHRKGIADAPTSLTIALVTSDTGAPSRDSLRSALQSWTFNKAVRGAPEGEASIPQDFRRR